MAAPSCGCGVGQDSSCMAHADKGRPHEAADHAEATGIAARLSALMLRRWPAPVHDRFVFFDFDRTLTVVHVFKSLAGWADSQVCTLPALCTMVRPHALTERGQMHRLCSLGPAWIEQAFGGTSRLALLRSLLASLTDAGCRVVLVTRGYVGVARKCLRDSELFDFFEQVHGNVGAAYGEGTQFDSDIASKPLPEDEERLLGSEYAEWDAKWQIIFRYMAEAKVPGSSVVLVDDDEDEIGSVGHAVSTVHVRGNAGIATEDVAALLKAAGLHAAPWAAELLRRWHALRDPLESRPPAIVMFNRKHLPVRLSRHLMVLEEELKACPNALRRIKMLMKSPMLLYSVAQHAFVQHVSLTGEVTFSIQERSEAMRLVTVGLKNIGLMDGEASRMPFALSRCSFAEWQRGESADSLDDESLEGSPHCDAASPTASTEETPGPAAPMEVSACEAQPAVRREVSRSTSGGNGDVLHLYQQPATKSSTRAQTRMLGSMVTMFQQAVLGLCPITMATAGIRRNIMCCHVVDTASPEDAVWARYRKVAPLGAGHFGEVFRATEVCSGREVAVKQLERLETDGLASDEGPAEVCTLRALAHPNLLRIYEVVQCSDFIHIISELAPGGSLSNYLRVHGTGAWIAGGMQQIVSAVAYCHRLHVLHGDLKPENVLISGVRPDGSPLCIVCDFGHATVCVGSAQVAAPGDPRYIPPEVVAEEGLSPKSDVYMLGVTAFELLTGGWLPFFGEKAMTLQMSYYKLKFGGVREDILSGSGPGWQDVDRLKKAAPPEARAVVFSMLSREPTSRPSAVEVLRCPWLMTSTAPCKSAYDALILADSSAGWGLWSPKHPQFAERLRVRARMSWTCRMLLAFMGSGLEPEEVHGARLLFRRMDEGGEGTVTRQVFLQAAKRVGLPEEDAQALYVAGDLHDQHFLDFKNVVMLFFDLGEYSEAVLLRQCRSVLNRIRGPCRSKRSVDQGATLDMDSLEALLGHRPDARLERVLRDFRTSLGPTVKVVTAEGLLRMLREDPFG